MPLALHETAPIHAPVAVLEHTVALHLVVEPGALVDVQIGVSGDADAIPHAVPELSVVLLAVRLHQTPVLVEQVVLELSRVDIAIGVLVGGEHAHARDLLVLAELALVEIPIRVVVLADAVSLAVLPVPLVLGSVGVLHESFAVSLTMLPVARIDVAIPVVELALAVPSVVLPVTVVQNTFLTVRAVRVLAAAMLLVIAPLAHIHITIGVAHLACGRLDFLGRGVLRQVQIEEDVVLFLLLGAGTAAHG
mmetsp:Transcript_10759/g.17669  ORF Transcript_10759/g.17669 Transcript_10759/m.17669 type:complete len:249 (+) Transcript_10759:349-1095(+)